MTGCQGGGGAGTQYSYAQLQGLWINAGGPRAVAPVAAAIALAESSGCSTALNPTDNNGTQSSFGLWQISNGTHNPPVPDIYDPAANAGQAVAKYQGAGGSFTPWGTYNSGAYKAYLNGSTTPDTGVSTAALTAASTGGPDACALNLGGQHIGILFGHGPSLPSTCLIRKTEVRALIGGLLIIGGTFVILPGVLVLAAFAFRASGAGQTAAGVARSLGPAGKAANTVIMAPSRRSERREQAAQAQQQAAARQARRQQQQVKGRHAKTGPNAPAQGKHARRGP